MSEEGVYYDLADEQAVLEVFAALGRLMNRKITGYIVVCQAETLPGDDFIIDPEDADTIASGFSLDSITGQPVNMLPDVMLSRLGGFVMSGILHRKGGGV